MFIPHQSSFMHNCMLYQFLTGFFVFHNHLSDITLPHHLPFFNFIQAFACFTLRLISWAVSILTSNQRNVSSVLSPSLVGASFGSWTFTRAQGDDWSSPHIIHSSQKPTGKLHCSMNWLSLFYADRMWSREGALMLKLMVISWRRIWFYSMKFDSLYHSYF